jgi:hypothetical protein
MGQKNRELLQFKPQCVSQFTYHCSLYGILFICIKYEPPVSGDETADIECDYGVIYNLIEEKCWMLYVFICDSCNSAKLYTLFL